MNLLVAAATPTTGNTFALPDPSGRIRDHIWTIYVWGTFGAATAAFQISHDGTNWFDPTGNTFTAAGAKNFEFKGKYVRGTVTGGAGASINMTLR